MQNKIQDFRSFNTPSNLNNILNQIYKIKVNHNYLNQLCVNPNYRNRGIATHIINKSIEVLEKPLHLFVDKNKSTTGYLIKFYKKKGFEIEYENEIEYKLIYKN